MTTYDHSVNATQIIGDALLLVGAKDEDDAVTGAALTNGLRALENMVKAWQQHGFHLWKRQEVVVFLNQSQSSYSLGPSSSDAEWCESDDFVYTLLNGAHSSSATTLTVDSTTSMTAGDRIGIELSDGTRQWTTILTVSSSTSLTIGTALTGAASDNGTVFTYTTRPQRPLEVIHARRAVYNGSDVPVNVEPLNEYFDTPNKSSSGTVTFVSYKPTLTSGTLYVWQTSNSVKNVVKLTVQEPIADFDTGSGTPDFPIEWAEALTFNLADRLEPTYRQLDAERRMGLKMQAREMLEQAKAFDMDMGSIYLQPR